MDLIEFWLLIRKNLVKDARMLWETILIENWSSNFTECDIAKELVETYDKDGPYGAKGIGEPGCVPTAPAIANAIYNAVGVRIKDLPITPERVLAAIREKKGLDLCGQEVGKDNNKACIIEE